MASGAPREILDSYDSREQDDFSLDVKCKRRICKGDKDLEHQSMQWRIYTRAYQGLCPDLCPCKFHQLQVA